MAVFTYESPGVYYQAADYSSDSAMGIRTDIAGFVGIAEQGPIDIPVAVESWRQFQAVFGGFTGAGYLAYSVRAFFENGGKRCWVTRVASLDSGAGARCASAILRSTKDDQPVWQVQASSEGRWGNQLRVRFLETNRAQTVVDAARSTEEYVTVGNTAGFSRATLVRIPDSESDRTIYKVVADVDHVRRRLYWVTRSGAVRMPYERPLNGLSGRESLAVESVEFSVIIMRRRTTVSIIEGLSLIPEHSNYGPRLLGQVWGLKNGEKTGKAINKSIPSIVITELRDSFSLSGNLSGRPIDIKPSDIPSVSTLNLSGGRDGLALLAPHDFIGKEVSPEDSDEIKRINTRGLRALGQVEEVSIVAIPDIHIQPLRPPEISPVERCSPSPCLAGAAPEPDASWEETVHAGSDELPPVFSEEEVYRVQAELLQHCEDLKDRIAVLDAPFVAATSALEGTSLIEKWRSSFDSRYGSLYYPWVTVVDPVRTNAGNTRSIPPSGHIAGQFARTDVSQGVHKAPANVALDWIQDVTVQVDAAQHGFLNARGVNVLRPLMGRAIRIMGARTLSSDPAWKYVNVRRLMVMIASALDAATQWAVFEPNNHGTRSKLHLAISNYLGMLWQQGALAGVSEEESFFVKCDEENNPPAIRANGQMNIDVGIAPAQPFEFIVLRVWRAGNELEFTESSHSSAW